MRYPQSFQSHDDELIQSDPKEKMKHNCTNSFLLLPQPLLYQINLHHIVIVGLFSYSNAKISYLGDTCTIRLSNFCC